MAIARKWKWMGLAGGVVLIALLCFGSMGCSYIAALRARGRIKTEMFTPKEHPPARLDVQGNIPVLHLYGTPEEMGTQYGTVLKGALAALHRYTTALLPNKTLQRFQDFARGVEPRLPGDIRTELAAVAKAAGIPYLYLVSMNVIPRLSCTTLVVSGEVTGGRPRLMGRNSEYFSFGLSNRGSLVVVRHPKNGTPSVSVSFLGMVGAFSGINGEGVAYANLLVFNARTDRVRTEGLPVQIALRLAGARCKSADAMVAFLRDQKHMIPMNVTVADARKAATLELGVAGGSAVRRPERGVLAASNHFRTPRLSAGEVKCKRYASLCASAAKHRGRFDVEKMQEALHAARLRNINLQAMVFEPAAMKLHLSVNRVPASAGPYTTFDVRKLLEMKGKEK